MGVAFVTSANFAVVRFVACMDMTMFFPVGTVGKPSVAALELAFERLLA